MENATKALLIAASILIAIVLIAVGIRVLSSTSGVSDSVDYVSDAMGVSIFNSQFEAYVGSQSASQVKALITKVAVTHREGSVHTVSIDAVAAPGNGIDSDGTWSDYFSNLAARIKTGYTYTVEIIGYNEGYVSRIQIK